jgi:hypothetical protein
MSVFLDSSVFPVGMLVNMQFAKQYEIAESTEYYDVSLGFVKTKGMNWPVRRPIVYRDSIIELRYTFRVDGVYLLFRVGDFSKEIFRRQWFVEEVRLLGRPDLAFQQVGVLPGPFIGKWRLFLLFER